MEHERKNHILESAPMNGGDGPLSYAQNSTYQKGVAVAAMNAIKEALPTALDLNLISSSSPKSIIKIADFGCSTGSNSIQVIGTIVQCLLDRIKPVKEPQFCSLEIQAIFNDLPTNDFNTLFAKLPRKRRQYYAAAALGSFYDRVLPSASIHVAHTSYALHFLSHAPEGISDPTSPNWNGERITYAGSSEAVVRAYSDQFKRDMEVFLSARAEELVGGGLVFLVVPGVPDLDVDSQTWASEIQLLGSCLIDMANEGIISKAKIESFNVPIYFPSEKELKQVIDQNGSFNIERIQILDHPKLHVAFPTVKARTLFLRAITEGLFVSHFGDEQVVNDLFERYSLKVAKAPFFLKPECHKAITFFVVLKRKMYE